jgi:hypothetical protein
MRWFALLLGLLVVNEAQADILPPGTKWVRHDVVFEGVKDHPEYVFFLWPRDLPRGQPGNSSVRLSPDGEATLGGNPLARAQHGGPFLFAMPVKLFGDNPSGPPQDDWFEGKGEGVLKSEALVGEIRSAPVSEPRERFVTHYHITIKDGKLETTLLSHETPGSASTPASTSAAVPVPNWKGLIVVGGGLAALVVALGLIVVWLLRSRTP